MSGLKYDTQPLVAALAEYDRTAPERNAAWDAVKNNADVAAAEKADEGALEAVQEAFYQVTKDRNSREGCLRVDIAFARNIAKLQGGQL